MKAPPPRPNVTIFCDASFDHATGAAGWGAWIKADGFESITHGAALKSKMIDTIQAELAAIANALAAARAHRLLSGIVMVQSDCLYALAAIRMVVTTALDSPAPEGLKTDRRKKKLPDHQHQVAVAIRTLVHETGIRLLVRHVRGHQVGGGRQWVNGACDRLAKKHMRATRAAASSANQESCEQTDEALHG